MTKSIFTVIFLVCISSLSRASLTAATCPSIDLSEKLPPVRNQGQSGQCYAFVAADMIGYAQGLSNKEAVSAIDVAVTMLKVTPQEIKASSKTVADFNSYKEISGGMSAADEYSKYRLKYEKVQNLFEEGGGYAPMAILAYQAKSGGVCLEQNLRSEGPNIDRDSQYYILDRFGKALGQTTESYAIYFPTSRELRMTSSSMSLGPTAKEICKIKKQEMDDFFKLTEKMNEQSFDKIEKDFAKACGQRKEIKPMKVATRFFNQDPNADTDAALVESLKNNTPPGISYDPSFLTEGRKSEVLPNSHASLVVGSRWNSKNNTCEFKIRNSWGQDCKIYAEEFQAQCEQGNIWVNSSDINTRVGRIDVIPNE